VIKQVLDITGVLVPVYRQVTCTSGVYSVRSGHRKFPSMWALSTKKIKQEILASWGDWSLEVEILSPEKFMSRDKAVIQQSGAVAIRSAIKVTAFGRRHLANLYNQCLRAGSGCAIQNGTGRRTSR
jgi:hypothetical protein